MRWQWFINLFMMFAVSSFAQQTADTLANSKTKQILAYIAGLPQQGKLLSGQFSGYSPDTFNTSLMDQISQQIGQTPGILGCDWACGWDYLTPPQNIINYSCNAALKTHWSLGGLVTVSMHLPNPVSANGGGYNSVGSLNFADLINMGTTTGQRWQSFLDRMVQGLSDLQQSGVTVLFRPFHEMNGDWFFWGNQDPQTFINVWINMFNYLTNTNNLHNILWVYSPDQSRGNRTTYYPGSAYVDIAALDVYVDDPTTMNGYNEMINLNKPFALGEVGPSTLNGQFQYTRWISAIQTLFPKVAYFQAWNDAWTPIANAYPCAFYNNHCMVNRDETTLNNTLINTTTTTSSTTTTTTSSTTTTTTSSTTTTTTSSTTKATTLSTTMAATSSTTTTITSSTTTTTTSSTTKAATLSTTMAATSSTTTTITSSTTTTTTSSTTKAATLSTTMAATSSTTTTTTSSTTKAATLSTTTAATSSTTTSTTSSTTKAATLSTTMAATSSTTTTITSSTTTTTTSSTTTTTTSSTTKAATSSTTTAGTSSTTKAATLSTTTTTTSSTTTAGTSSTTTTATTSTSSTSNSPSSTVIYNFSNGVGQWQGNNVVGGPWESNEFTFASTDSLKANIQLYAGSLYYIYTDQVSTFTFASYQRLVARARVAPWGFQTGGTMLGRLYIKTNSSWTWYDTGAVQLDNSTATQVVLNLNTIPSSSLADIREVGIQYTSSSDGSQTAVYVAYITAEN